jgi:hypothetical protein
MFSCFPSFIDNSIRIANFSTRLVQFPFLKKQAQMDSPYELIVYTVQNMPLSLV